MLWGATRVKRVGQKVKAWRGVVEGAKWARTLLVVARGKVSRFRIGQF